MSLQPPAQDAELRLGNKVVRVQENTLVDQYGQPVALRAKSLLLLMTLLKSNGRVVSKADLADAVWPGIAVTDESISQCVADIRRYIGDDARSVIETFPKQGYRINAGVVPEATVRTSQNGLVMIGAGLAASAALAITVLMSFDLGTAEAPPSDVIAVLPFKTEGDAAGHTAFADDFSQELSVRLAELSRFSVLPRSVSSVLGSDRASAADRAASLGAHYAVDGQIQSTGQQLRIKVQLTDLKDDQLLWVSDFDGQTSQLMQLRDDITKKIAEAVLAPPTPQDRVRIAFKETSNPRAYAEVLRGRRAASSFTREDSYLAERHFRQAIELDPAYARAYAEIAALHAIRFENGWITLSDADETKSLHFANEAMRLDPDLWLAHYALGRLHSVFGDKDYTLAEHHLEQAMSLQPANDDARVYYGAVKTFQGEAQIAVEILEQAIASHPAPPFWYYLSLGNALIQAGHFEEAAAALEQCLYQMPGAPYCLRFQIANYGIMGQLDDAEWAIEEYEFAGFEASVSSIMGLFVTQDPASRASLEAGLRATGMPE